MKDLFSRIGDMDAYFSTIIYYANGVKNKANPFFDECYNCISELAVVTKKEVKKKIKEITSDDWEVRKKYTKNTVIW